MTTAPLCACGCGQSVQRAQTAYLKHGIRRGDFNRYVKGHNASAVDRPACACGCGRLVRRCRDRYVRGHGRRTQTLAERFWAMVRKSDGCWVWTGATNDFGYGIITDRGSKRHLRAHRLSWELAHGSTPGGQLVLHKCDNPPCIRPDHLFLGDQADNANDKVKKGRHVYGQKSPLARLTEASALEIRCGGRDTRSRRFFANKFGVSRGAICSVQAGRTWAHLQDRSVA